MSEHDNIKLFVFKTLRAMDGVPISDDQLVATIQVLISPKPTLSAINTATEEMESYGFLSATRDDVFKNKTWTLTVRGKHKASQL